MGGASSVNNSKVSDIDSKTHTTRDNTVKPKQLSEKELLLKKKQEEDRLLKWPLPKEEKEVDFIPNSQIDSQRYSLILDQYLKHISTSRRPIKVTTIKFPDAQRIETKTSDYVDSKVFNSAHVQTVLKTTTDYSSTISPTDEMRNLLARLNVAHIESNDNIQRKLDALSREAERVMGVVIRETTDEQDRLLEYSQNIQARHEELYREWLQKYVIELDRWRSMKLAELHERLEDSKKTINSVLQRKLTIVNQEVEAAKSQIFLEEQRKQAKEVGDIVSDVNDISQKKKSKQMGTAVNTDIHLKIRANAGNREVARETPVDTDPDYPYLE